MAINKNAILWFGFAILVLGGLTYVFWGVDLIPDQVSAALPGTFLGYLDDAAAILLMFFLMAKMRQKITGTKNQPGLGWKGAIIYIPVIAIILAYVFWALDVIPDSAPFIGYADDVTAILIGALMLAKLSRKLKKNGN